jgi:hypothetical protein
MTNKLQNFVNPCLRRIMGIRWHKIISYNELWEATGEKPIILQTIMSKWRLICHTSRKGDESIGKQALDWIPLGA